MKLTIIFLTSLCISSASAEQHEYLHSFEVNIQKKSENFQKAMAMAEVVFHLGKHYNEIPYGKKNDIKQEETCYEMTDLSKKQSCTSSILELWQSQLKECFKLASDSLERGKCVKESVSEKNFKLTSDVNAFVNQSFDYLIQSMEFCSLISDKAEQIDCYRIAMALSDGEIKVKDGRVLWKTFKERRITREHCKHLPGHGLALFKACLYSASAVFDSGAYWNWRAQRKNFPTLIHSYQDFRKAFCEFSATRGFDQPLFYQLHDQYCLNKSLMSRSYAKSKCSGSELKSTDKKEAIRIGICHLFSRDFDRQIKGVALLEKNADESVIGDLRTYLVNYSPIYESVASKVILILIDRGDKKLLGSLQEMLMHFEDPLRLNLALDGLMEIKDPSISIRIINEYLKSLEHPQFQRERISKLEYKLEKAEEEWKDEKQPLRIKFDGKFYDIEFKDGKLTANKEWVGKLSERVGVFSSWSFQRGESYKGFEIIFNEKLGLILSRKNNLDAGGPFLLAASPDFKFITFDYGTGPGPRGLEIRDDRGKVLLEDSYYDDLKWTEKGFEYGFPVSLPNDLNDRTKECDAVGVAWQVRRILFNGSEKKDMGVIEEVRCSN